MNENLTVFAREIYNRYGEICRNLTREYTSDDKINDTYNYILKYLNKDNYNDYVLP
jgi:hypothetical protein